MKFLVEKPEWLSEAWWRAIRTGVQVFVATFAAVLIDVLIKYGNGGEFDLERLYLQGFILAIAMGLAAVMNRG